MITLRRWFLLWTCLTVGVLVFLKDTLIEKRGFEKVVKSEANEGMDIERLTADALRWTDLDLIVAPRYANGTFITVRNVTALWNTPLRRWKPFQGFFPF